MTVRTNPDTGDRVTIQIPDEVAEFFSNLKKYEDKVLTVTSSSLNPANAGFYIKGETFPFPFNWATQIQPKRN